MLKNKIRDKRILVILFAEIVIFILGFIYFYKNIEDVKLSADNLISDKAIIIENPPTELGNTKGCYIDNSLTASSGTEQSDAQKSEELANTITTNNIDLQPGTYEITFNYSADSHDNVYSADTAYHNWKAALGRTNIGIKPGENSQITYRYSTLRKAKGYHINFRYSGNGYLFITGVTIHHTNLLVRMFIVIYLFFVFVADIFIFFWNRWSKEKKQLIICGIVGVLFTSLPLLSPYYPGEGNDLGFHMARIEGLKNAIMSGSLPSRVSLFWNNGHGYAAPIYYSELFLVIPAGLRIVGFAMQSCMKVYVILVNVFTFICAWFSFHGILKQKRASLLATALYLFAPYRLVCIYQRAALGEYTAQIFFPLVIYGLYRIYRKDETTSKDIRVIMPLIIGISGIIECHVISTVLVAIFIILFCIIMLKRTFTTVIFRRLIKTLICTITVNLWFILPLVDVIIHWNGMSLWNNENLGTMPECGARLYELLLPFEDYRFGENPSLNSSGTYTPLTIGAGLVLCIMGFVVICVKIERNERKENTYDDWNLGKMFFVLSFFAMWISSIYFPWDLIQESGKIGSVLANNIQYPARFLGIAAAFLALLGGIDYKLANENESLAQWTNIIMIVLIAGCMLSSGYFMKSFCEYVDWEYFADDDSVDSRAIGFGEYIPAGTDMNSFENDDCVELDNGSSVNIEDEVRKNNAYYLSCCNVNNSSSSIAVPLLYYSGYDAEISSVPADDSKFVVGDKVALRAGKGMNVNIEIPAEFSGTIKIYYSESLLWKISEYISVISIILIVGIYIRGKHEPFIA